MSFAQNLADGFGSGSLRTPNGEGMNDLVNHDLVLIET